MNIKKAKLEMFMMSEQVWKDAERWQLSIQHGQVAMKMVKTLNLRLFVTENRLNHAGSRRELQNTEKQINSLYMRLQRPLTTMNKVLQTLTEIRDNTARMLNRLTLWMDDDIVVKHMITPTLKASKLLVVLQFLSQRYDAEWEVKEVVVNDLEHISNSYELDLLMDGWGTCSHAGGQEFTMILREYYKIVGRNQSLVINT
ncbi:uncharacterized protein LOC128258421 [Drosophila gunungcola]|uniref:Uncharacterized protein n=1 Tax=Drosophila gunungcola TaxID=103775 RepID=A0A9P9YQ24_9MUSC|nr:uncharacterized protein LOC128258421 [Drosophila gunungcola]KAI8040798.1 hypothetical protein M5D96_006741 [Drosophila gunungcola]